MCKLWSYLFPKPTPVIEPVEEPIIEEPIEEEPEEEPEIIIPEEKTEKYALLVGINKYRPDLNCDLRGCVNDAIGIKEDLINIFGFNNDNIRMLLNEQATYNNMLSNLRWLVDHEDAELVFGYSMHGSQTPDLNNEEIDGLDEVLVPYDHSWNVPLIDDIIGEIVEKTPQSSFLTILADSCNSESASRGFFQDRRSLLLRKNKARCIKSNSDMQHEGIGLKKIGTRAPLNHVMYAACKDSETAADAFIDGKWQGSFTAYRRKFWGNNKTWASIHPDVLNTIRQHGFSQTPCLNGRELDTRPIFGGA